MGKSTARRDGPRKLNEKTNSEEWRGFGKDVGEREQETTSAEQRELVAR